MSAPRLRKVSSRKELDNQIDDYVTQGYDILEQGEHSALMRRKTWGSAGGHVLWALLTVWWTLGIGNLIYALIAHYTAAQVLVRIDEV
jgi:hypothetical protein